jgi:hypothetical protein
VASQNLFSLLYQYFVPGSTIRRPFRASVRVADDTPGAQEGKRYGVTADSI